MIKFYLFRTVRIVKLVILPKVGVHLCSAMDIDSIYKPEGPEFEYSRDFYIINNNNVFKLDFLPNHFFREFQV